jgi:hypothetical protein
MLALYRAGRQAEILDAYNDAHRTRDGTLTTGHKSTNSIFYDVGSCIEILTRL